MKSVRAHSISRRAHEVLSQIVRVRNAIMDKCTEWERDGDLLDGRIRWDQIAAMLEKLCTLETLFVEVLDDLGVSIDESAMTLRAILEQNACSDLSPQLLRRAVKTVRELFSDSTWLWDALNTDGPADRPLIDTAKGGLPYSESVSGGAERVVSVQMTQDGKCFPVTVTLERTFTMTPLLTRVLAILVSRSTASGHNANDEGMTADEIIDVMKELFDWVLAPHSLDMALCRIRDAFESNGLSRDLIETNGGRIRLTVGGMGAHQINAGNLADVKSVSMAPENGEKSGPTM